MEKLRVYITALNALYEVPEAALKKLSDGDEQGFWETVVQVPGVRFDVLRDAPYSGGWTGNVPEGIKNHREFLYSGKIDLPSEPGSRFKRCIYVLVVHVDFEFGRADLIESYADLLREAGYADLFNPWLVQTA